MSLLFPRNANGRVFSKFLLAQRVLFGLLFISHGVQKVRNFPELAGGAFPDPLGIGSQMSVGLAIFGELFCSIAFMLGFMYRLALVPMITTMVMAFFVIHNGSIAGGELAFVYLVVFVLMFFAGPGRYSVDYSLSRFLFNDRG